MAKLIVTNGDSAAANIRASGLKGRVLEWRDMLHDGPVPASDSLEIVSDARADYIAQALGLDFGEVRADFAQRDGLISAHIAYSDVELWFEHDLFDQLQLIQLLAFFAREPERVGLRLMQADTYLGALAPERMPDLAPTATPVTSLQLETGRTAWAAFTAATPEGIAALAAAHMAHLPWLAPALRRLLAELPAPGSGLSLTQERTLLALKDGPVSAGHLFGVVTGQEEAQFLGDLGFFLRLDEMAFGAEPLIAGLPHTVRAVPTFTPSDPPGPEQAGYRAYASSLVRLTPAGDAVLRGELDHAGVNAIDRWLGGTRIAGANPWRYDRVAGQVIAPAMALS